MKPFAFYFVTHPDVVIDAEVPVTQWPLSPIGHARMRAGLAQPWVGKLSAIFSSTEQKAIDTAEHLTRHRSLPLATIEELGEIDRSATGYLPAREFESVADRFFAEPHASVRGWERAVDAQARIVTAVFDTVQAHGPFDGPVAIVSHGAVGALLYCHLTGQSIDRRFDQPRNGGGNYFCFPFAPADAHSAWHPIDVARADDCRGLTA
ncbi:MAG: histidine phosphatase family protein [Variovorax sp.]